MKVLVLGGSRFFGKQLVEQALAAGHEVAVLNRGQSGNNAPPSAEPLIADRRDPQALERCLQNRRWDVVYDQLCFTPEDARVADILFRDRTERYLFTSSMSVYNKGPDLHEYAFNPVEHPLKTGHDFPYAEGKRQAEAFLFQASQLPAVSVRIPCVVGLDDYTRRLHFHVERTLQEKPIYFPVPDARISLIQASEAAAFLLWIGTQKSPLGVFNACADEPVALSSMMNLIGEITRKEPVLAEAASEESHSPYGVPTDCFMNTRKARELGYEFSRTSEWLPNLIKEIALQSQN